MIGCCDSPSALWDTRRRNRQQKDSQLPISMLSVVLKTAREFTQSKERRSPLFSIKEGNEGCTSSKELQPKFSFSSENSDCKINYACFYPRVLISLLLNEISPQEKSFSIHECNVHFKLRLA
ncbi:Hypothetical predicted protein [Podarcis lilfordi]|uniref:Uncharacterized protein n=1 Tax=Podarcis lilfordi TaxID=74358 RepID=A0AA35K011_9SAUR|nr:Hypothetical predicted protein [Podarcis lilfordi]